MAHPNGGSGNTFRTRHTFAEALRYVMGRNISFISTTGENVIAKRSTARDGITDIIVFYGERSRHGSVCDSCWGYRIDCNQSRIGQCSEAFDKIIK